MGASFFTAEDFRAKTNVSRETIERLQVYAELLSERQKVQNLVSRNSLEDLWERHMLDSFQLAEHCQSSSGRIIDIGSGAGFPGLVLAIATNRPVILIESHGRKCSFLREVVEATSAPAVVLNTRVETYAAESAENPVDILTARALAPLPKLCEMAESLSARTCLFQKGARWRDELTEAQKVWKIRLKMFESRTSPDGRILRITGLARR